MICDYIQGLPLMQGIHDSGKGAPSTGSHEDGEHSEGKDAIKVNRIAQVSHRLIILEFPKYAQSLTL